MEDVSFLDGENFGKNGKDNFSYKIIVLKQIEKCSQIASKEFCGGFWIKKPVSVGGSLTMSETYNPDNRQEFYNSVQVLNSLLIPKFDNKMLKDYERVKKLFEDISKHCKKLEDEGVKEFDIEEFYNMSKINLSFELFNALLNLFTRLNFMNEAGYEG